MRLNFLSVNLRAVLECAETYLRIPTVLKIESLQRRPKAVRSRAGLIDVAGTRVGLPDARLPQRKLDQQCSPRACVRSKVTALDETGRRRPRRQVQAKNDFIMVNRLQGGRSLSVAEPSS